MRLPPAAAHIVHVDLAEQGPTCSVRQPPEQTALYFCSLDTFSHAVVDFLIVPSFFRYGLFFG
jgi:hypothetical protein